MNSAFSNTRLNPERLYLTARKDLFFTKRQFILVPSTIAAFFLLIGLIAGSTGSAPVDIYGGLFTVTLYLGGLITTSSVFRDRHRQDSIHNWLMLPASTLEKFLVRFLFSTAGVIIIALMTVWISSLLISLANLLLYGHSVLLFNPLSSEIWYGLQGYLALHSLFFLGASWFKKNHLIKTLLTLFVIQILIGLISSGFGYIFIFRLFRENRFLMETTPFVGNWPLSGRTIAAAVRILVQGIIPLSCWTAAYFRLKEAEVKDGI